MNNDLISRSALLEEFEWLKMTVGSGSVGSINDAIERIKKAPAVDAMRVFRCKDCEFSRPVRREDGSVLKRTLSCFIGRGYQQNVFGKEYSIISRDNFCASGMRKIDAASDWRDGDD